MDVVVPTLKSDVHGDVSNGSSPEANLGSVPGQAEVEEHEDHAIFELPSLPVSSVLKDVVQGVESGPGVSVTEHLEHRATNDLHEVDASMMDIQEVQELTDNTKEVESQEEQEEYQESISDSARSRSKEEKSAKRAFLKSGSLIEDHCVSYELPPENEGEFAVFDLVWGKVKSHPWWPGQIFHPSDSSEKAMKYYKKDCYLVAYFGDRTFAWNDASVLKPFRNHFPLAERQNNLEAFQNAVNCALEEVSRRVELGLACSCASDEAFDKVKYQIVENSGIRAESSKREGVDRTTGVDSFQPDKLTDYVRALALFPTSGVNRLELVVAKAQLLAFTQLRGYDSLADFEYYEGLVEFDADTLPENQGTSRENGRTKKGPRKRKHDLRDIVYRRRKEKTVLELMGDSMHYLDGEFDSYDEDEHTMISPSVKGKQRALGFFTDDFTSLPSTKTISVAKVSEEAPASHQQSFKVGERIRRAAFQLTGSTPIIKGSIEESKKHSGDDADEILESLDDTLTESTPVRSKTLSLEDMLSQLHLGAQDPRKGYSFLADIISFFSEFRNLAVTTQKQKLRKRKKKFPIPVVGSPETFEFDDRNDSYWTDMVVQGDAEAKPARRGRKRKDELVVSNDHGMPLQRKPRKYTRKQYYKGNHELVADMPTMDEKQLDLSIGDNKQLNLPTELLLKFSEMGSVPSEVNLNKMFRCFGPLKDSETEVDKQISCARVVFKKRTDAEIAYSSAATFNIFGSTLVKFQLNYTPASLRSSAHALSNGKEDAT